MNKILTTPNFFIIGAPKCGTTSMAQWLSEHPNIFMSKVKEPHYFNKDHRHRVVTDRTHYLSLFKDAGPEHHVIGEASVWYLYSEEAVDHILDASTDSPIRFVVMLRNPVKMAYSLHEQQVFNMNEPETNFLEAWKLQDERKQNKNLGITTRDPQLLVYGEVCKLGAQLQRLYEKVPKEQVKVVLLDDIKENALGVYRDVLSFLEVPYDERISFEAENTAKVRRSPVLAQTTKLLGKTKQKLGITKGFGLLNKANAVNVKSR
ncbi:MAG: sulfotransferase, partial [Bacteroidota bacterium]